MKEILIFISSAAFIFYGYLCLMTNHMKAEFERYKLQQFRTLTGSLELMGGIGLLVGYAFQPLAAISSLGLAILMLMGLIVRIQQRDPAYQLAPAFILMLINIFIFRGSI